MSNPIGESIIEDNTDTPGKILALGKKVSIMGKVMIVLAILIIVFLIPAIVYFAKNNNVKNDIENKKTEISALENALSEQSNPENLRYPYMAIDNFYIISSTGSEGLRLIDLSYNKLPNVTSWSVPQLHNLNLSSNQIARFEKNALNSTQQINLSNNKLSSFVNNVLTQIQTLDVSNNQISDVTMFISSNTWPSDNNTLKKLILNNNQIQNIDDAKSKLNAAFPSADIII